MNSNNIFVDTNVLIGACIGRQDDVNCLQYLFSFKGKRLFVSSLSIAQFVSVMQKSMKDKLIRDKVRYWLKKFSVISFSKEDIANSLSIENSDIEDNIQYVIGCKLKCYYFVTNNIKDYGFINIRALKPTAVRSIK